MPLADLQVFQVLSTPAHLDTTILVSERNTIDKNENIAEGNRFYIKGVLERIHLMLLWLEMMLIMIKKKDYTDTINHSYLVENF